MSDLSLQVMFKMIHFEKKWPQKKKKKKKKKWPRVQEKNKTKQITAHYNRP